MAGQGPFSCQFGLLQYSDGLLGFISVLSVSNSVLRLHLGCLRTCWIELSQRQHDFALVQELKFGPFLDTFWTHIRLLFVAKRISGVHLGALAGS